MLTRHRESLGAQYEEAENKQRRQVNTGLCSTGKERKRKAEKASEKEKQRERICAAHDRRRRAKQELLTSSSRYSEIAAQ